MAVYTFNDVEFTNGQIVIENEMDQVSENIQYVREELRWRVIAAIRGISYKVGPGGPAVNVAAAIRWQLIANTSTVLATSGATASQSAVNLSGLKNVALSGLTEDSDHTISIRLQTNEDGVSSWIDQANVLGPWTFVKTPDVDYVSLFATHYRSAGGPATIEYPWGAYHVLSQTTMLAVLAGPSLIVHRDSEF